jgi:hypothetical protein
MADLRCKYDYDYDYVMFLIIYIKMLLDCDWLISVQLISNSSVKFCNNGAKICKSSRNGHSHFLKIKQDEVATTP